MSETTHRQPTFFLLDHASGWHDRELKPSEEIPSEESAGENVILASDGTLRLQADPEGLFGWFSNAQGKPSDTLGGLALPTWMAQDGAGRLYLLEKSNPILRRDDPFVREFYQVPSLGEEIPGSHFGVRKLFRPQAIAALDFPLAMAVSAIMMGTLMALLYIGHRLFDLTHILDPQK